MEVSISEEPGARKPHAVICAGRTPGNWRSDPDGGKLSESALDNACIRGVINERV